MMPIFFHVESHLWIAYLFFFNGLLINYLFRSFSNDYLGLTKPIEAQVLGAFFISLSLNGLLLVLLDLFGLNFNHMKYILPIISVWLTFICFLQFKKIIHRDVFSTDYDFKRLSLYLIVFVILFYNGGLIEQISDAWWHMSLANKIAYASSFDLENGHLNGRYSRYYPPLWHGNLALAKTLSGISLPVLWNSFTAWGAMIKVMGFYLLALSLSGNKNIASLSALLFILLPGVGDSYLRVSAWPSHIAYTAWFCLFYVSFSLLSTLQPSIRGLLDGVRALFKKKALVLSALLLVLLINFSHQAELFWFALAFLFYYFGLTIYCLLRRSDSLNPEHSKWLIDLIGRVLCVSALIISIWFVYQEWQDTQINPDILLVYAIPIFTLLVFNYLQFQNTKKSKIYFDKTAKALSLLLVFALMLSVDTRHLLSLFSPELAYPKERFHELPLHAIGWFGEELKIPGWHLQLRFGLLYSGVLSIPIALFLAFHRPSRLTLFLASTSFFAFLFCASPYLYHWLQEIMNYHSPWRVSLMIFHPITISSAIVVCWHELMDKRR